MESEKLTQLGQSLSSIGWRIGCALFTGCEKAILEPFIRHIYGAEIARETAAEDIAAFRSKHSSEKQVESEVEVGPPKAA